MRFGAIKVKLLLTILFFCCIQLSVADELDAYKATCKEIGFKPKTPAFGDCVLELKKRSSGTSNPTSQNISKTQKTKAEYEEEATLFFREQERKYKDNLESDKAQRDAEYQRQLAEYERQKQDYENRLAQIERDKERQKGLKLLEFGLRMGAGQSARDAGMATAGMVPILPSYPYANNRPQMQLQETYQITTPNGGNFNCRYDPNVRRAICY